jgi:hypothetical protein
MLLGITAMTVSVAQADPGGSGPSPNANAYVSTHGTDTGTCPKSAPCATINYAISVAPAGGTVLVEPGTYDQTVTILQSVNVIGSGPGNTTINGADTPASGPTGVVNIGSDPTVISGPVQVSGFTITNPVADVSNGGEPFAVVLLDKNATNAVTITDNVITEGRADSGRSTDAPVGIWSYHSDPGGNTVISDNTIDGFFQGALLEDNGPVAVTGNTFQNMVSCGAGTSCASTYPGEGLFFLSDQGTSLTQQNATSNVFQDYAGYGISDGAGYPGGYIGSISGALTDNSFDLQGAVGDQAAAFAGAAAIYLSSDGAGSGLALTVDENDGSTTSPSDAIDISATNGGSTSISEQNNDIRVLPGGQPGHHGPGEPPLPHGFHH